MRIGRALHGKTGKETHWAVLGQEEVLWDRVFKAPSLSTRRPGPVVGIAETQNVICLVERYASAALLV